MPQMSPMNWQFLLYLFTAFMTLMIITINFLPFNNLKFKSNKNYKKLFNNKW